MVKKKAWFWESAKPGWIFFDQLQHLDGCCEIINRKALVHGRYLKKPQHLSPLEDSKARN